MLRGNVSKDRYYTAINYTRGLFDSKGAIKALDATYWSRAMQLTDVYDAMPQDRRDEWNDNIKKLTTPSFTSEVVLPTLQNLLNSRLKFLAERVDGVFKSLFGTHVTNSPFAVEKFMIIAKDMLKQGHKVPKRRLPVELWSNSQVTTALMDMA